jgi:hypothetical protein
MPLTDALGILNIFCGALLVGALVLESLAVLPAIRKVPPEVSLQVAHHVGGAAWRYLPVAGVATYATALGIVILQWNFASLSAGWFIAGLVIMSTAIAVNYGMYLPIDRKVSSWLVNEIPADNAAVMLRWQRIQNTRTALYSLAYLCFAAGNVTG